MPESLDMSYGPTYPCYLGQSISTWSNTQGSTYLTYIRKVTAREHHEQTDHEIIARHSGGGSRSSGNVILRYK